jgi:hypothetical protein
MHRPISVLIGIVLCVLLVRLGRNADRYTTHVEALERLLEWRVTPMLLGIVNALLVWWWLGWDLNPLPQIQDEAAYLLQAKLFAGGRWTGTARPLPEFFAQLYVFTEPVLASKYPPGLSLLLAPFVAMQFAALAPMMFAAVTGALIFVLARRTTSGSVAMLTWLLWTSGSALLRYQASFLSQTATVALWVATLYLLLEYRTRYRPWALAALGACVGTLAITRPVSAIALAVPVGVIVIRDVWGRRDWKPFTMAALAGTVVVAILPVHNRMTTGDWRLSPLVAYSSRYTPFDFPGFGYAKNQRVAPLPPDLDSVRTYLAEARRQHTLPALPATLRSRVWYTTIDIFSGWRAPFLLFALLGVLVMPMSGRFAVALSVGLLLTYAFHAHWPFWTVYYFEGYPAVVFASAVGMWAFADMVCRPRKGGWKLLPAVPVVDIRVRAATLMLCGVVLIPTMMFLPRYRAAWRRGTTFQRQFATALSVVERESPRSIVFVDYGQNHDVHSSLIWNVPDLATAKTWIAYDRGVDDLRLMRLAPDRRAYVYRAHQGALSRLPPLVELEKLVAR